MLKHVIEYAIKSLVEVPESVTINVVQDGTKEVFEITVAPQDIGKVIGKEGQTIRALRMLLTSIADQGKEIEVTVIK